MLATIARGLAHLAVYLLLTAIGLWLFAPVSDQPMEGERHALSKRA